MLTYVPKFYDQLHRSVSRTLGGSVGALSEIRRAVRVDLPDKFEEMKPRFDALSAEVQQAGAGITEALTKKVEAAAKQIVKELKPEPTSAPVPDIQARFAPLLRLLIQAQGIALDATPDETVKGKQLKDDVAIEALRNSEAAGSATDLPPDLRQNFDAALARFTENRAAYRFQRWWAMQQLCVAIATLPPTSDAQNKT